jgi:hypothetical protein
MGTGMNGPVLAWKSYAINASNHADRDFADVEDARARLSAVLMKEFAQEGLMTFDVRFRSVPPVLSEDRR